MILIRTFIIGLTVLWPVFTADAQLPNAAFFAKGFKPNAFSFTDQTGVALNTVTTSNSVTLTGIGTRAVAATCSGCTLERNTSGSWAASAGGFRKGDTLRIRLTSSGSNGTAVTASVTVGAVTSSLWSVTTINEVSPSSLSLSHSSRNKCFTASYTAGSGWGNVNVQYQNSGASWVTLATINGDTNQSNYSVCLPGDGWYGSAWASVPVRIQRVNNTSQTSAFPANLTCSAVGGSASPTSTIDEDCDQSWDNATPSSSWIGYEYPSGHYGASASPGTNVTCPSAASLGYQTGDYLQVAVGGCTVVLNFYSSGNCTGAVQLTYSTCNGSSIWPGFNNIGFNPSTGSTIALPSNIPAMGSYSLPLGGACTAGVYTGQCAGCNRIQRTGENGQVRYHCRYSSEVITYTYY